ncbi:MULTISPECIES: hypothetical protein [Anaeromyxobacter]|uniref:hypothetical protein n=1 Tax=Anaeromyxobacter TaxID=161492 RepID=UPI001F59C3B0|nr:MULTISPECIES: hypothetical protein [unclassified Anaeromyxobacter]
MSKHRGRAVTETIPGGIRITVAVRKNWPMLLFLPVWLAGWAFGEITVIGTLAGAPEISNSPRPIGFLVVWLSAWTFGGALAIAAFLWNAFGRETLEISGRTLRIRQHALGIGRTREYPLDQVRALRVAAAPLQPFSFAGSMRYWGFGNGVVAFDHGGRTIRIFTVDEDEASSIVESLKPRLGPA